MAVKQLMLVLVAGLGTAGIGGNFLLLPVMLPAGAFWIWPICYWAGGGLLLLGGIAVDASILMLLSRLLGLRGRGHAWR